ncbi:RusA family crossover junction endodeoxyribonuclease [Paenibacillus sp. FSL M7-0896]|uniref:RusA family crossover junction endodeoxyribonuclease n=1 Tax=Paenibacillus sp. FSL M7-0896 TaxID=2921610 RepID=UPI0030D8FAC7
MGTQAERLILTGTAPSVNHMYRNVMLKGRRCRVLTAQAHIWVEETIMKSVLWRKQNQWSMATGKVVVRIWYYFPDKKRRDTHNTLKALLDALEAAYIYEDDKYALPWIMDYQVDKENPRIEIEFEKV